MRTHQTSSPSSLAKAQGHAPENAMSLPPAQMIINVIKHISPVLRTTTVNNIFFIKMHQSTSRGGMAVDAVVIGQLHNNGCHAASTAWPIFRV